MSPPQAYHRERSRQGAIPLSTQIYQGLGALPETLQLFALGSLLLFYYNQVLGLPASSASLALTLALVIDAFADPLVGSLSDNFESRLGRRHPFMYASALPLGIALTLTFLPPATLSHAGLFAWLLCCAVASRVAMTFFSVPWNALYAELTEDYAERSAVVMWRFLMAWVGGVAFGLAVWTYVFPSTPQYTPGHLNPHGYTLFAPLLGSLVALAVLMTTHLTVREIPYLLQLAPGSSPRRGNVLVELAQAARNRDFMLLAAGILVSAAITGTGTALDLYALTYFWGLTPESLRWFSIAVVGSVAAFAMLGPLQARFEKHHVVVVGSLFNLAAGFTLVGLRFAHVLPENGEPRLLVVLIGYTIVRVTSDTLIGIMFASMVADTLDAQELRTGRRQEGVFSAALSFAGKATSGFGVMIGGVLLEHVIAMPIGASPGAIDAGVITRLGVVAGFGLPAFFLIPIALTAVYRVTRARHVEIRAGLAQRHGERARLSPSAARTDSGTGSPPGTRSPSP